VAFNQYQQWRKAGVNKRNIESHQCNGWYIRKRNGVMAKAEAYSARRNRLMARTAALAAPLYTAAPRASATLQRAGSGAAKWLTSQKSSNAKKMAKSESNQ